MPSASRVARSPGIDQRRPDLPLNRALQETLRGRGLKPLILGRNEMGNQAFHRLYDELMG